MFRGYYAAAWIQSCAVHRTEIGSGHAVETHVIWLMLMGADRLLAAMPFADNLLPSSRRELGKQVRVVSVPPRATLLQPGVKVSGAYFVESGAIRVFYLDADGHEGTLYRIERGQSCVLALNCLFSEMVYPAWAEAGDEGVTFASLDGPTARTLMGQDVSFMRALFEQVSSRLYGLLARLEEAIRLPLEGRLTNLLIDLADESGTVHSSQERLASHLGTSREVVSRLARRLAKEGLISVTYGKVKVLDRGRLSNLSTRVTDA